MKLASCPIYEREPGRCYHANNFLTPNDPTVLEVAAHIVNALRATRREDSAVNRVIQAFNFVSMGIEYVYDESQQGYTDYWQFPCETLSLKTGDCEDTAFLLASLLLALRIDSRCVRVVLGSFRQEDHAWVEVSVNNQWCVLESTSDDPFPGWFDRGYDYIAELEVYKARCVLVGTRGIYNKYELRYEY